MQFSALHKCIAVTFFLVSINRFIAWELGLAFTRARPVNNWRPAHLPCAYQIGFHYDLGIIYCCILSIKQSRKAFLQRDRSSIFRNNCNSKKEERMKFRGWVWSWPVIAAPRWCSSGQRPLKACFDGKSCQWRSHQVPTKISENMINWHLPAATAIQISFSRINLSSARMLENNCER